MRIEDLSKDEVANVPSDKDKYNYVSEDPQSLLASDDDGSRHVYPKFNKDALYGEILLNVGMEFVNLE